MVFNRSAAFELEQGGVQELPLGHKPAMLIVQRPEALISLFDRGKGFRSCPRQGRIPPGALSFNLSPAARRFILQLELVVVNHAFDKLVPSNHLLPCRLDDGGLFCSQFLALLTCIHGINTARPWILPSCRSCKAVFASLNLYSRVRN